MAKTKPAQSSVTFLPEHMHPPMASSTAFHVLFNEQGNLCIFHDQPLPDYLKWVEYDGDLQTVTLVMQSGKIQDLGIRIKSEHTENLTRCREALVFFVQDGDVTDLAVAPIVTRGLNS